MGTGDECRKRPCRICRCWFIPNPRLKDRQKTCGNSECQRKWHQKKCQEWNRRNADYFKANYLQKKIISATETPNQSPSFKLNNRLKSGLPLSYVQEVISLQHLIIIEYFGQLLFRRFQEALRVQVAVMTGETFRLPP
jgi:hypothetical protein